MPKVVTEYLIENGCNPKDYAYVRTEASNYIIKHIASNTKVNIRY
jgi:hypothetical protein